MLRHIITPLESSFTLQLPTEMLGKTVEIIAFEVKEINQTEPNEKMKIERVKRIEELTKSSLTDLSKFKFDRNEANNYEE